LVKKRATVSQPKRTTQESKQADLRDLALYDTYNFDEHYVFDDLPPEKAEALMIGWPNINAKDTQNNSPEAREMVAIAKTHNGVLTGYVIPVASERDDARITLDGFTIKASKAEAWKIYKRFEARKESGVHSWRDEKGGLHSIRSHSDESPSDFVEVKPGVWRFWWD